ncbi:hypothetical protein AA958_30410 [Streptomyces sp. CNQ-509]|uniref:ScyD/ScyE family protein n=1 Tax=unclassified Streptomyces TaxID=2593676 RepID=UPI00062DD147|nr:ScyD/ScyE family protein [Streptomyces sp. CNQ-509]AKH85815.1 hypothetical protein AA958_30410 [Streptomyces sp. CNQ-509]
MSSKNRKWKRAVLSAGVLGGVTAVTLPAPAVADETEPAIEVVAGELNNPRGLHVDRHGRILVAESGKGMAGCEAGKQCVGATGSVYRIDGRKQGRVVNGLPSLAAGVANPQQPISATGPVDVEPSAFGYVVLNGGGNTNEFRAGLGAGAKHLGTLRHSAGHTLADLVDYETRMDPDWVLGEPPTPNEPSSVQSNAWRLAKTGKGGYLATDAAGNDLLGISAFGSIRAEAVFPGNTVNGQLSEAVPGGVVETRDGTVYVSDMGALKPGAARIWKIAPGHRPVVFAEGLTAVSDLALDKSGDLVALTITGGYGPEGPKPGAVNVVDTGTGDVTPVETGDRLTMSSGVAVGPDDEIYVTNNSVGTSGEVLKITR